jgi:hypothetical protein
VFVPDLRDSNGLMSSVKGPPISDFASKKDVGDAVDGAPKTEVSAPVKYGRLVPTIGEYSAVCVNLSMLAEDLDLRHGTIVNDPKNGVLGRIDLAHTPILQEDYHATAWDVAKIYSQGDIVIYSSTLYVYVSPIDGNHTTPGINTAIWRLTTDANYFTWYAAVTISTAGDKWSAIPFPVSP